jgi:excisionase family DNA binding protein
MNMYPRPERRAIATPFAQIKREAVQWLDPGRIPVGMVTVLAGIGGLGKSQWTDLLAARLSRGEFGKPGVSLLATAEDSESATVRPRLEAAGAKIELVHSITIQSDDGIEDGITIPGDLDQVEALVAELGARLLVIDPLVAHLPSEIDSHKDQSVRLALAPLYRLAQAQNCAVVAVLHLNKASGMAPLMRLGGSGAFGNAARSVLLLDRDPDDPDGEEGNQRGRARDRRAGTAARPRHRASSGDREGRRGGATLSRLLTAGEVAAMLSVSAETVLRWTRRGELSAFRLPGGAIRYDAAELERWLGEHATMGAATEKTPVNRHRAQGGVSLVSPVNPPRLAAKTEKET